VRVLIVTSPLPGHLLPAIPVAWALRGAGHEVLVATAGDAADFAAGAGLPVVNVDPDARDRARRGHPSTGVSPSGPSAVRGTQLAHAVAMFAAASDGMAARVLALARDWHPNCVLHSSLDGAGPAAAGELDLPLVEHTLALGTQPAEVPIRLLAAMRTPWAGAAARARAVVDPGPPSVRIGRDGQAWGCRFTPYNGGAVLPAWVVAPGECPRVCVTMGTVLPAIPGLGDGIFDLALAAVQDLSVEVLLTAGPAQLDRLGPLPAQVRALPWAPMSAVLPGCTAVVHHGGAGTSVAALVTGTPQLMLPSMADQFDVARAVGERGAGRVLLPEEVSVGTLHAALRDLLADGSVRQHAAQVQRENAELPNPATVVQRLRAMLY